MKMLRRAESAYDEGLQYRGRNDFIKEHRFGGNAKAEGNVLTVTRICRVGTKSSGKHRFRGLDFSFWDTESDRQALAKDFPLHWDAMGRTIATDDTRAYSL
jgi:hypothetical protein